MVESQRRLALVDVEQPGASAAVSSSPPHCNHLVQFYEEEAFLYDATSRFLGEGLAAGDSAVVIATEAHRDAFCASLQAKGIDVERARARGRLELLDARDTLTTIMAGAAPDWDRFKTLVGDALERTASRAETGRIRAYGEMVDLLWQDENPRGAIRLEELWNDLGKVRPFTLLCAYRMEHFLHSTHREPFEEICRVHDHVVPAEGYRESDDRATRLREISRLQQRARALESELRHRKQLEAALRAAREEAEAANRAKDEFLAMLGHELRNPLSPILTALELMKLRGDGLLSPEQEVIHRQAHHLTRLVDDLLDVSRIASGKVQLRKQVVDLRDVLAKATEMAGPLLEQRMHHFEVRAPPRALRVHGDEARLAQVIANLLTNAAKYTAPGGHISVVARRERNMLLIEVRDDGAGINAELLPRVFDLFVQGRQSVDRAGGGLGVGLALVRNLVALHGGAVDARSAGLGKGSTFIVRLPALDALHDASEEGSGLPEVPLKSVDAAGRRILLVDDNQDALEMLEMLLSGAGHDVRTATSGADALRTAADFEPEIAILDIGLPAMDGYELASRLRAQMGSGAPRLVALSGYGQESDRVRSRAAGFHLHLVKPLDASTLLDLIDRDLDRKRARTRGRA
jgi:signal transduction histidine kinase/ActR/RegA family two-component response regulator